MKLKNLLITSIVITNLFLISTMALAVPSASILYQETDLGGGLWRYDYTFSNTSTNEYLYSVRLNFDNYYTVINSILPGGWAGFWGQISPTIFLEAHTNNPGDDIMPGGAQSGFSFTINSDVGSIPYTAYFDDHQEGRYPISDNTTALAPEPVSSILFLAGGAILALRNRLRRKRQIT